MFALQSKRLANLLQISPHLERKGSMRRAGDDLHSSSKVRIRLGGIDGQIGAMSGEIDAVGEEI